jgi:hypothetical protein
MRTTNLAQRIEPKEISSFFGCNGFSRIEGLTLTTSCVVLCQEGATM